MKLKETKERNKIFIFESARNEKEAENILSFRKLLESHFISRLILVNFEELSLKMFDDDKEAIIEEIFMLADNPDNLPIIFYGGDPGDFIDFLIFCEWENRTDMEWIENPRDINDLKEVIKEISEC